ncbi:MarR family winged helix-turn-helix transcriptional regulator [Azospirillum sp. TSH100]|uniref:MarR family winged helix-turn-helix transcriptional regulator n=1 Tax=Azospirillum sp. TSH100 TaxID=652764 RepID=UPI000D68CC5C|nr:MarR family winged helix-turn-helix transcriptional regulator [Azospirillum sp. TSH100]QCG89925.1 MarR family transcriptional regulator [Azospirillum sp. TSH100]
MPHDADFASLPRLPVSVEEIAGHPRYLQARKLYSESFLALFDRNPFLIRLLTDTSRYLLFTVSVILDANHDIERRETWFTVGRLKERMAVFGMTSPRHVDHLIERMCAVGFVETAHPPGDRRVTLLRLTDRMLAHDREWLATDYVILDALRPENGYGRVRNRDPFLHAAIRRQSLALLPEGARLLSAQTDFLLFFSRPGGLMVLEALFEAALSSADGWQSPFAFGDVADRFGLSRSHVRSVVQAAEAAGFIKLHGRGGRLVEILPPLWRSDAVGHGVGARLRDIAFLRASVELAPAE